jgi:hypothetical protein
LNPCDPAQQPAGEPGRLPCPAPYFETVTHTGTLAIGTPQRFNFVPVPGFPVSINCSTSRFIELRLYAPDGTTLLASDINDETGIDTGAFTANEIQYVFSDALTYIIEVKDQGSICDFDLTISPGGFGFTYTDSAHAVYDAIYIESKQRIFVLCAVNQGTFGAAAGVSVVVLDSTNMSIIDTIILVASSVTAFVKACHVLFYNPTDNSVWVFERDGATGNTTFLDRLNPLTGALLEHAAWGDPKNMMNFGVYSPADNMIYGLKDNTNTATIRVFDCLSRTFLAGEIAVPARSNNPSQFAYNPTLGFVYGFVVNTSGSFVNLYKLSAGALASSTAMSAQFFPGTEAPNIIADHGGLFYGTDPSRTLKTVDPATGTVAILSYLTATPSTGGQYNLAAFAWDTCRDCLSIGLYGNTFFTGFSGLQGALAAARYGATGTIIEGSILYHGRFGGQPDTQFWTQCLWNADMNRIVAIGPTQIFRI